jgi:hypothetical protein
LNSGETISIGSSNQNDAVRPLDEAVEVLQLVLVETERRQIHHQHLGIEDPQHRLFAKGDGEGRDPELDLLVPPLGLDPSILRAPLLGDVEPRHRLDPADHGPVDDLWHRLDVVEDTVDAKADEAVLPLGLDVDVAGSGVVGVLEQRLPRSMPEDRSLSARLTEWRRP